MNYNNIEAGDKDKLDASLNPLAVIGGTATVVPGVFSVNAGVSGTYTMPVFAMAGGLAKNVDDTLRSGRMDFAAGTGMSFTMTDKVGFDILARIGTPEGIFASLWNSTSTLTSVHGVGTSISEPTQTTYHTWVNSLMTAFALQCKLKF